MNDHDKGGDEANRFQLLNGGVRIWIEQGAIHLAAFDSPHSDPVELTAKMARVLAGKLVEFAGRLDE